MTAYVYIQSEPALWTVGFYDPSGKWHPDSDYDKREEAATRVHYLNGGDDKEIQNDHADPKTQNADLLAALEEIIAECPDPTLPYGKRIVEIACAALAKAKKG